MISAWELYLWTRLDAFEVIAIMTCVFVVIWLVIAGIEGMIGAGERENDPDKIRAGMMLRSNYLKVAVCIIVLTMFIPSKKDAAMIWIVPQLATVENAELLQGEAAEIYKLAKDALKESIGTETVTE